MFTLISSHSKNWHAAEPLHTMHRLKSRSLPESSQLWLLHGCRWVTHFLLASSFICLQVGHAAPSASAPCVLFCSGCGRCCTSFIEKSDTKQTTIVCPLGDDEGGSWVFDHRDTQENNRRCSMSRGELLFPFQKSSHFLKTSQSVLIPAPAEGIQPTKMTKNDWDCV